MATSDREANLLAIELRYPKVSYLYIIVILQITSKNLFANNIIKGDNLVETFKAIKKLWELKVPVFVNKKNGQISIALPKKQFKFSGGKIPKSMRIKFET